MVRTRVRRDHGKLSTPTEGDFTRLFDASSVGAPAARQLRMHTPASVRHRLGWRLSLARSNDADQSASGGPADARRPRRRGDGRLSTFARTLLQHVGIGAMVLIAVASIATAVSVRVARDQALRQPVAAGEVLATRIVAPLVTPGVYDADSTELTTLNARVLLRKVGSAIERVTVRSEDGVILYSDDPRLIGGSDALDPVARTAMTRQRVDFQIADLSRSDRVLDRHLGESLEVYVGTRDSSGRPILVEVYFGMDRVHADEAALIRRTVAVVLVALFGLGLLLVPLAYSLARRASRTGGNGG